MLTLNNLEKVTENRKRIGRGGDRGGTSGRGHKGQRSRSGASIKPSFEGGQMPLSRRLPRRGFGNNAFKREVHTVNLIDLERVFESGQTVDRTALLETRLLRKKSGLVKILANGLLTKKLIVHADLFSSTAAEAIKKAGGEAHVIEEKQSGSPTSKL